MHFLVYKTTNKINDKFYIGAHECLNLDDAYLGSGKVLFRAIKKYGKQNFHREILHSCITREDMYQIESELVTQDLISDSNCYNAKLGGFGGWSHWAGTDRHRKTCREVGLNNRERLIAYNKTAEARARTSLRNKTTNTANQFHVGHKHSEETRKKMSATQSDMCWVCDKDDLKKIYKSQLNEYLERGYQRGKRLRVKNGTYGSMWINKNSINKFVKSSDIEKYLTDGWIRGRLNPTKSSKNDCKVDSDIN